MGLDLDLDPCDLGIVLLKIDKKVSVKHANIDHRVHLDLRDGRLVSGGFEFC